MSAGASSGSSAARQSSTCVRTKSSLSSSGGNSSAGTGTPSDSLAGGAGGGPSSMTLGVDGSGIGTKTGVSLSLGISAFHARKPSPRIASAAAPAMRCRVMVSTLFLPSRPPIFPHASRLALPPPVYCPAPARPPIIVSSSGTRASVATYAGFSRYSRRCRPRRRRCHRWLGTVPAHVEGRFLLHPGARRFVL